MVYAVQVKRLRHEDPIGSLIWKNSKRKRTTDDDKDNSCEEFVFRLAKTLDTEQPGNHVLLEGRLQGETYKLHTVAKKIRLDGKSNDSEPAITESKETPCLDTEVKEDLISQELQQMVSEYLNSQRDQKGSLSISTNTIAEDYVYDMYFSDSAGPVPAGAVGYIELNADEEKLLFSESDNESGKEFCDDEDSNAEDNYRYDYPDEDYDEQCCESDDGLRDVLGRLKLSDRYWHGKDRIKKEDDEESDIAW